MSNTIDVVNRYYAALNARDWDAYADLVSDDSRLTAPGFSGAGREAVKAFDQSWSLAFDGFRVTPRRQVVDGDTVAGENHCAGVHTRALETGAGTIPPTGRAFDAVYASFVVVAHGKIVAQSLHFDQLEVMTQLGLMPKPS